MNSALYEGAIRHRRLAGPVRDELHQDLFMAYLDLDELPGLLEGHHLLCSARRPALAWFRRSDHLGDPSIDLAEAVRLIVLNQTGQRPAGPVRLLTHLRCYGHCFNPVSFYYCFEPGGERLAAAVAHVTNTPWGESHSYVMPARSVADHGSAKIVSASMRKRLHVSPLMGMEHHYEIRLSEPGERISVHIQSSTEEHPERAMFDATLSLARREWSATQLRRMLARYPFHTIRIVARIYGHALSLRLRGAAYHPHPSANVSA